MGLISPKQSAKMAEDIGKLFELEMSLNEDKLSDNE